MSNNKGIEEFILNLNKNLVRIADGKLSDEIKEVYKEEVDYSYSEFEPLSYKRRYDNSGFGDENNWDIKVGLKSNSVTLELINETKAVNSPSRLDMIIEEGVYDWNGLMPKKRPVYERTSDRLKGEQVTENTLKSELKKMGYKFE